MVVSLFGRIWLNSRLAMIGQGNLFIDCNSLSGRSLILLGPRSIQLKIGVFKHGLHLSSPLIQLSKSGRATNNGNPRMNM